MNKEQRENWFDYYTNKRVHHQFHQVELLRFLDVQTILEVGPYLGFVTSMLKNCGYDVTTLDFAEQRFSDPQVPHMQMDLSTDIAGKIPKFDVIICCETLEHLYWDKSLDVLKNFLDSKSRYCLISVPYEGFQFYHEIYFNLFMFSSRFQMRKLVHLLKFKQKHEDPFEHKWEIGYRGFPLRRWEAAIESTGWRIRRRSFSFATRAVFHVLEQP